MNDPKLGVMLGLMMACIPVHQAAAQTGFPNRPIRVLTTGQGGGPDVAARLIAPEAGAIIGQPIVVDARPAGIGVGMSLASTTADGYTIMFGPGATWIGPLLQDVKTYDALTDLAPVSLVARGPNLLIVHVSVPVSTVKELIELAKASPGKLNYSSGSTGSSGHLAAELFNSMAGTKITRIDYKAGGQETVDLMAGVVQMAFSSGASAAGFLQSGKLKAIAVSSPKPTILFPNLPTIASTLPGFESEQIIGAFAPSRTPEVVVRRLQEAIAQALLKPEVKDRLIKVGLEPQGSTPEQLMQAVKDEIRRLEPVIKAIKQKKSD